MAYIDLSCLHVCMQYIKYIHEMVLLLHCKARPCLGQTHISTHTTQYHIVNLHLCMIVFKAKSFGEADGWMVLEKIQSSFFHIICFQGKSIHGSN